jgi:hypothetical protein
MHQRVEMCKFQSRREQEVGEKCRGEPVHTRQCKWAILREKAAGWSRVKNGGTREKICVIFGAGGSRRWEKNGQVSQYTSDNVDELSLEKEQLVGAE